MSVVSLIAPDRSPHMQVLPPQPATRRDLAFERWFHDHHFVASREPLVRLGATPGLVAARVDGGRWVRVHRSVYRPASAPLSEHGRLLAAVLACGPGALASHSAAAWLWRLGDDPSPVVSTFGGRHPRPSGVTVHQVKLAAEASRRHGIPVTNPLRTVLDLATYSDEAALVVALDRGMAARLFTLDAVQAEVDRWAQVRRPGLPLLRRVLNDFGALPVSMRSPSVSQNAFARVLARAGLPAPVAEHPVLSGRYRLDFAYPDVMLAFEIDSESFHGGWQETQDDHRRRRMLARLGWTVQVFTTEDVWRRPDSVVEEVRMELVMRGVHCEQTAGGERPPPRRTRRPGRGTPEAGPAPPSA